MRLGPTKALIICEKLFEDQLPEILRTLRRRHGTKFILVVASDQRREDMRAWCGPDDVIIVSSHIDDQAAKERLSGEALFERARFIEDELGIVMLRDVVLQDRTYAGAMLGYGQYEVHSNSGRRDYLDVLGDLVFYFDYWQKLLQREGVDFVFARTGGISATCLVHRAMQRSIPVSRIVHTRLGNLYTWSSSGYHGNSFIQEEWQRIGDDIEILPEPERPVAPKSEQNMAAVKVRRSAKHLAKSVFTTTLTRIIWRAQDVARRRWSKRLPYAAVLRKELAAWFMYRRLGKLVEENFAKVTARPYVLFLLSVEPEYSTLTLAKEFNNTEAVVRQLAVSLPAGYNLVVKEHVTNIGNRSIDFYERLLRVPNVVLADYHILGIALAARSEAVSAISGTIGIEASMFGKDVIGFSERTEYAFLPNVHFVRSLADLPQIVHRACRKKSPDEVIRTRRDIAKFRRAIENLSYEMPHGYVMSTGTRIADDQAERAVDILERLIAHQRRRDGVGALVSAEAS